MYKRKPFEQCKIYFHGFSQTEQEEFDKYTVKLGGEVALEAIKASHILCHADAAQLRVELDERVFPVTERDEPELDRNYCLQNAHIHKIPIKDRLVLEFNSNRSSSRGALLPSRKLGSRRSDKPE